MKKIFSALVIGAMAVGLATADTKVSLNYRNGIQLFNYTHKGADGLFASTYGNEIAGLPNAETGDAYSLFVMNGWNAGKDNLGLSAGGDIFSVTATLQPTIGTDDVIFHIFRINAEYENFYASAGWTGDGLMNYRVPRDSNNGNEEGSYFERFKLGSAFKNSEGLAANNQAGFGTNRNFFAYAGYSLVINDKSNVKFQAAVFSDRKWDSYTTEDNGGNLGWGVFITPKVKKVFDAELFAKGHKDKFDNQVIVLGAYGKPLVTPLIADAGIGGSVVLYDGELSEFNFDVRFLFEINENLTITSMNKFSRLAKKVANGEATDSKGNGDAVDAISGLTAFNSSQMLWNMIAVRYKVNSTVTLIGSLAQSTDLDDGFNQGVHVNDGTQIAFFPHAQIYASPKISLYTGITFAAGGIGADEEANKDIDVVVNVPLFFRVKM